MIALCAAAAAYLVVLVAAFYAEVGGIRRHRIEAASAVALVLLACLTKESSVAAVGLAVLVCLVAPVSRAAWRTLAVATTVVFAFLVIRFALLPLPPGYTDLPSRYHVNELIVRPFATLILPFRRSEMAAVPWLPIALVGCLVVGACVAPHAGSVTAPAFMWRRCRLCSFWSRSRP